MPSNDLYPCEISPEVKELLQQFDELQQRIDQERSQNNSGNNRERIDIFVLRQNQIALHTCTGQDINTLQNWIINNWLKPYIEDNFNWKSNISSFLLSAPTTREKPPRSIAASSIQIAIAQKRRVNRTIQAG